MQDINQVIIVGCGPSGIGASQILSKNQIQHIILQARNRIGGRVFSHKLDGVWVDMGAMIVHHPNQNNIIKELMDKIGWKSYNKRYTSKQIMNGPNKEMEQSTKERGYEIYKYILYNLQKTAKESQKDMSFLQAMMIHFKPYELTESKEVIDFVNTLLRIHGSIQGTQLQNLSGKELYVDDQSDVIPEGGYAKLIQEIYNFCPRTVFFNEKVCEINYTTDIIEVKTNNKTFYTKKVISSLPLGVLKNKVVKFIPQLPQTHLKPINNIGFGVFNKIQVNFVQPFWDVSKQYILLISQNNRKYFRMRSIIQNGQYILCVYVSGNISKELSRLSDEQIVNDFVDFLTIFYTKNEIKVKNYVVSRWHEDQYTFGSYSYFHVGKTQFKDIDELKKPIEDKIWFIGQHCRAQMAGTVQAAFTSGIEAAKEVIAILNKNK